MTKNKIDFVGINKCFSGVAILNDINFSIPENSIFCLLGRSGSGKTTLMRMLIGLEKIDSGIITIDGINSDLYNKTNTVGFIQQKYSNFPRMTVKENILQGKKNLSENEFNELINEFDMKGYEMYYPSQLSGGMNQRVAIMRCIAQDSDILCADEPFGSLDVSLRTKAQIYFYNIIKQNQKTALCITHDIEESLMIADYIGVLSHQSKTLTVLENNLFDSLIRSEEIRFSYEFMEQKRYITSLI